MTPLQAVNAQVTIRNSQGLHARPATSFVETANRFASDIRVHKGSLDVNGKSIMEVMILAATQGTQLELCAQGPDAPQAIDALRDLIERNFDEE